MLRHFSLLAILISGLFHVQPAWGLDLHKQYEEELIRWALDQAKLEPDPHPEGKIIERIEVIREDIIAQSDPWPNFFNWVHVKTRDFVVRQELLVAPGQVWDQALVDESARNLRQLFVLAVVRTVACRSITPNHVVLLVVTKDLWSIRLNTNWSMVGSKVQFVTLSPTEMNFLGRNKRIGLSISLKRFDTAELFQEGNLHIRDSITLGQAYVDNRLMGTRLNLSESFYTYLAGSIPCGGKGEGGRAWCPDKSPGSLEGMYSFLSLGRPLYSLATKWAFKWTGYAYYHQTRSYTQDLDLKTVRYERSTGEILEIPRIYDEQALQTEGTLVRSFGLNIKHDVAGGLGLSRERYSPPENAPFDQATLQQYSRDFLPFSEDAFYVFLSYLLHGTRFITLLNVNSFALTEDFSLGPEISLGSSFVTNLQDTSLSYSRWNASALYRWYVYGDLLSVSAAVSTRWQPRANPFGFNDHLLNNALDLGLRNISPRIWIGRLHLLARTSLINKNLSHSPYMLGGDQGLRGYPSAQFEGENLFTVNAEYRSLPINLFTLHFGFVAFYDGGAVWGGPDPLDPSTTLPFSYHHSLGLGLRAHFPQFDKESLRLDFGVPLSKGRGSVGTWFTFAFRQVF